MLSDFLKNAQQTPVNMQFAPPPVPELPVFMPKQKQQSGGGSIIDMIMKVFAGGGGGGAIGM